MAAITMTRTSLSMMIRMVSMTNSLSLWMTEAQLIRVGKKPNTSAALRTITKVETSDAAAENVIFHTLPFTLTSKPSMRVRHPKGQIHLSSRLVEEEVALAKSIL